MIPARGVAPPSNIPDILGRRAWPSGRLARLGATRGFHHGLLVVAGPLPPIVAQLLLMLALPVAVGMLVRFSRPALASRSQPCFL